MCIVAAAVVPIVMLFENIDGISGEGASQEPIRGYYLEAFQFIGFMMLPLFVVLSSVMLIQIEFRNNTWKQVLVAPQHRWQILVTKFLVFQLVVIAFLLLFNAFMAVAAVPVWILYPEYKVFSYLDHGAHLMKLNGLVFLSVLGLGGIQLWLALRYRNFVVPAAIGLTLWFLVPIMYEFKWPYTDFHPYGYSARMIIARFQPDIPGTLMLSAGYMVVALAGAYRELLSGRVVK